HQEEGPDGHGLPGQQEHPKAKIAVTGCPNFSLALTLRYLQRKKQDQDWDFSSMKAMLNGAEPISVKIMEEFTHALEKYNLHDYAMMPVYGMAEVTLAVSFTPVFTPRVITTLDTEELDRNGRAVPVTSGSHKTTRQLSAVGVALSNVAVRIVNDKDEPLEETFVGHIQIKSPAVTAGYYKNPEATAGLFCGEWMRTGDLGFFLNGYLYISGRFKEIIFMNGKNYFANDLETLAGTLDDIVYGKVAVGGYTDPETSKEKIVIFVASIPESKAEATLQTLRALFRTSLGIPIDELVLLRSNEFPKTSSGKIQRYLMLNRHRNGEYPNKFN
ncbi:MAG: AMP-binding protein, partial [Bacteroidota bacterium]